MSDNLKVEVGMMPGQILAIVADDLTGALDAAAPLSAIAGGAVVATSPDALAGALSASSPVVAVSTRSREVPAVEARARVERVLRELPADARIFKKIDSRLKGNIEAELDALGERPLLVLPAIPEFGRVVRDGAVQGFGIDQPIPVGVAIGHHAGRADVPDTLEQAELAAILAEAPEDAVLVGTRGLAQALAETMGLPPPHRRSTLPAPACFAVGSTDPITLAQVERLRDALPGLAHVEAPSGRVPPPPVRRAAVTLLQATPGEDADPASVAREFALGLRPWLEAARSMLLTGGATAEAVLDALGVTVMTVDGEAEPGMAVCRAGGRIIVTKSGGFGSPDAFVRLATRQVGAGV